MARAESRPALGHVTLVTGPEEFLGERAVRAVREQVRRHDADAELSETDAATLTMAVLGDLAAPSLFSSIRCVVVRRLEELPEESVPGLLQYAASPADDVALVLAHGGGQKGSGVLTRLRKLERVVEVKSASPRPSELPGFVGQELRGHGSRIEPDAAEFLVQAVGQDLRSLAAAAHQLASDFEGSTLTTEMVKRYFGGRAEAKSFAVADLALHGQAAEALEELRWALERGTAPVLVTSALAGSLRGLAKFMGAPRGMRNNDLAREVGVPPWKIDVLRRQSHGWDADGVGRAIRSVARADADVKGQASDAAYALEKMVLDVVRARPRR
ncbi:DNA polymerase III subunit delta [Nocardioides aurantiacus]|uniref:DNA-directed DNA polymerase n=1 Tax=Nocardioides aurantiacus TaxID=86796 RepID=A0A3N2CVV7_9ACTN|nr:DNA polymerase III subunit delta [Nocardioides aurantiacus]ROR91603.1 DNA polymerase III delta subunit [Nocardioides aurantiacus]